MAGFGCISLFPVHCRHIIKVEFVHEGLSVKTQAIYSVHLREDIGSFRVKGERWLGLKGELADTTNQQPSSAQQAQTFWLQWVEAAFPDLDSRAYFLPPVYFNRVPMARQSVVGQDVLVLQSLQSTQQQTPSGQPGQTKQSTTSTHTSQSTGQSKSRKAGKTKRSTPSTQPRQSNQPAMTTTTAPWGSIPQPRCVVYSDVRDDVAMQRVLVCLQQMSEQTGEVMFGLSQLQFGQYLGEPCYAAAAAQLPLPANLPSALPRNWKQGDFDVLFIHRHYGFVICEVKAVGDNLSKLNLSQQEVENIIRAKLQQAVSQLDKAEAMLSHLVSDIAPGLRITKTIAVPNLTGHQVQQAISGDIQLTQDLCRCLGTSDPADIAALCLCCDQLSDPKTPWDVSSHVLRELGHWWQRRVAGAGPDSHMTPGVYKTLVARFCGPATSVIVPCISPPRVSVKTLGQAVWWTGECYTAVITLFPEQVHLLHTAPPTLFVAGPPGTGKTVVLLLMAIQWLRSNNEVCILSTWPRSAASCTMLYHLLQQILKTQLSAIASPTKLHFLQYNFGNKSSFEKAVDDVLQMASGGSLHIVADEAAPADKQYFRDFCKELETRVPHLYMWAASYFTDHAPAGWQVGEFRRPLRSPPAVVREVTKGQEISQARNVKSYVSRRVPDPTDGPHVRLVSHEGPSHSPRTSSDCEECGREVASILQELGVGAPVTATSSAPATTSFSSSGSVAPPCLQWRDVLVLFWRNLSENSGVVTGLRKAGIPVKVMKDEDMEDVATARSDVVWAALGDCVQGLERKVVVCLETGPFLAPAGPEAKGMCGALTPRSHGFPYA